VKFTSILAIYALFWVMSAFVLLPFGVKTHDEEGVAKVPGQADSAPVRFRPGLLALRATIVAALAFGLYYANYVNGWLSVEDINFFGHPPAEPASSGY
jgi:predicted secreted protein